MHKPTWVSFSVLFFTVSAVSAQRCSDQIDFNYFSCEMACTPNEASTDLINRCETLGRFGCELKRCDGDKGFECVGPSRSEITTCGNSRVSFQSGHNSENTVNFRLDLNTPPVKGDYYFLVNARLAMRKFLPNVKASIIEFIESVFGDTGVRFGVGIYRHEDMLDMGFESLLDLTDDHEKARNAVNGISLANARGGSDANLQALFKAAAQDFRSDARKMMFLIGDTAGHEPSKVGSGDALTRETVAQTLKDAGITLVGINQRNPGLNRNTSSFGISPAVETGGNQASFIAGETGGLVVWRTISVFSAFWKAKANVERVYDISIGSCAPFVTKVDGGSKFPLTVAKGRKQAVARLRLELNSGFCTPFTCELMMTENGMEIEPLMLEVPVATNGSCSS